MGVYIISSGDQAKIGYSRDVDKRLTSYLTHNPDFVLVGVLRGNRADETFLHQFFASYRRRGEWFEITGLFADFCSALKTDPEAVQDWLDSKQGKTQQRVSRTTALARNVRRRRRALSLTQAQLAGASGLPRATVANLESGFANPTISVLCAVANVFRCGIDVLLEDGL